MARPLKNLAEIAVIGGGLAGLAAARQATRLGRLVTLFEGSGMYGGQVATAEQVDGLGGARALLGAGRGDSPARGSAQDRRPGDRNADRVARNRRQAHAHRR